MNLLELYTSVQGEGPRVGIPTQFVRFAGCNMRCPGWPCDTPYAIYPEQWRKEAQKVDVEELAVRIGMERSENGAKNICFTGGEPLSQPIGDLCRLDLELKDNGYTTEYFTNGSVVIPGWLNRDQIIMDWKLEGSGEAGSFLVERNINLHRTGNIKFVVKDREDLHEARAFTIEWLDAHPPVEATLWVGAAWDEIDPAEIIEFIQQYQLPWRLNVQVHKYIFDPVARGI